MELAILVIVVIVALAFDFTNGFHDTANAMAPSVATGALKPKPAVALSASLNLVGAFLSIEVARTVGSGIVDLTGVDGEQLMLIVLCGLTGAIVWNVLTWLFGLPSSSSHALFGGLIGATIAALGLSGVLWGGVSQKILIPALFAPVIAGFVAFIGTWLVHRVTRNISERAEKRSFRWGQIGAASLMSLAHGTNDAQKTMGVIFLALVAHGTIDPDADMPLWVRVTCALAIAAGTYMGGWRVIRTLGKGIVDISPRQGMSADFSSASIILTSSHLGLPLSTTHVASGSVIGSGLARDDVKVRWSVARRMLIAWIITLPAAGAVGAACLLLTNLFDHFWGAVVVTTILVVACTAMWLRSRLDPVGHHNVADDWEAPKGEHKRTIDRELSAVASHIAPISRPRKRKKKRGKNGRKRGK
ncbi:inorganic phosphate transporter, PiT family [Agrococcus baldri]|uniref:Phosphate transporter n=1 Tax=Agrococcus baldri TaxID=153730 RepID=A0AA94KZI0_9MICO|nr:inorganic phosphate transporter [Agrococcus baldri]SFS10062.1 inorganic phosphate transporter, PiT family [Agrococcus baldri]